MAIDSLLKWHALVASRSAQALEALLANDVIFHSPIVHTPQIGKAITTRYLLAALHDFGNETFRYVRELSGTHDAVLEFMLELDGIAINGVDMLRWNDEGRIVENGADVAGGQTMMASGLALRATQRDSCQSG